MRSTVSLSPPGRVALLYAGVVVFVVLAAFTARSIWTRVAGRDRARQRAAAMLDLVDERTPPRPTDAPGAMAWLRLELDRYEAHIADADRAALYRSFAAPPIACPTCWRRSRDARGGTPASRLASHASAAPLADATSCRCAASGSSPPTAAPSSSRAGARSMATPDRRDASDGVEPLRPRDRAAARRGASARSIARSARPRCRRCRRDVAAARAAVRRRPRTARSCRRRGMARDRRTPRRGELALLSARPGRAAFAPEEFFFRFDPARGRGAAGVLGVLSRRRRSRSRVDGHARRWTSGRASTASLALDLAFDIDWRALARRPSIRRWSARRSTLADRRAATWSSARRRARRRRAGRRFARPCDALADARAPIERGDAAVAAASRHRATGGARWPRFRCRIARGC